MLNLVHIRKAILSIALLICTAPVNAKSVPGLDTYTAQYTLSYNKTKFGTSEHRFERLSTDRYQFVTTTQLSMALVQGQIIERSEGRYIHGTWAPEHYAFNRVKLPANKNNKIDFDWAKNLATIKTYKGTHTLPLQPNLQDKLSMTLALRTQIMAEAPEAAIQAISGKRIKTYRLTIRERGPLKTRLGTLDTLNVQMCKAGSACTEFWLAPEYGYLPVKMVYQDAKNRKITAQISAFSKS